MVRIHLYPRSRAMKASAIPVLPDVGSTRTVLPGVMRPCFSASSIRDRPRRSLTLEHGPNDSSLPTNLVPFETGSVCVVYLCYGKIG